MTKKEILKMIFGPVDNTAQWQQVGKDDDYDDIARAGMTMMIIIIGDDSRPAQRGRRSEMWLDCRKVCDAQTSSAAQPSCPPPLCSALSCELAHLISPIASHLRPRHSRFNSAKLDANGIRSVQMIQQGLVEPA